MMLSLAPKRSRAMILANFIVGFIGAMIFDWVTVSVRVSAPLLDYTQPVSSDLFGALPGVIVGIIYIVIWHTYSRRYFGADDKVFMHGVAAGAGGMLLWLVLRVITSGFL